MDDNPTYYRFERPLIMEIEDKPVTMIAEHVTAAYRAGMTSERQMIAEDVLAPIFLAFNEAAEDPKARIPSYLSAAIVAAKARCHWEGD